jgi:hypothetical protein
VDAKGIVPPYRIHCSAAVVGDKWLIHGGRRPGKFNVTNQTFVFDFTCNRSVTAQHTLGFSWLCYLLMKGCWYLPHLLAVAMPSMAFQNFAGPACGSAPRLEVDGPLRTRRPQQARLRVDTPGGCAARAGGRC